MVKKISSSTKNILNSLSKATQRFSFPDMVRDALAAVPFLAGKGVLFLINIALTALAAVLFLYLLFSMVKPYRIVVSPDRRQEVIITDSRYFDILQKAGFAEVDQQVFYGRELFPRGTAKQAPAKKNQTSLFEILGIVSVAGEKAAMIRALETGREYYCMEGDMIGDYTVTRILEDRVIFKSDTNTVEVTR